MAYVHRPCALSYSRGLRHPAGPLTPLTSLVLRVSLSIWACLAALTGPRRVYPASCGKSLVDFPRHGQVGQRRKVVWRRGVGKHVVKQGCHIIVNLTPRVPTPLRPNPAGRGMGKPLSEGEE